MQLQHSLNFGEIAYTTVLDQLSTTITTLIFEGCNLEIGPKSLLGNVILEKLHVLNCQEIKLHSGGLQFPAALALKVKIENIAESFTLPDEAFGPRVKTTGWDSPRLKLGAWKSMQTSALPVQTAGAKVWTAKV